MSSASIGPAGVERALGSRLAVVSASTHRVASDAIVVRSVRTFRRGMAMALVACVAIVVTNPAVLDELARGWLWLAGSLAGFAMAVTLAWSYLFHDPTLATARSKGRAGAVEISDREVVVFLEGAERRYARDRIVGGWIEPLGTGHAAVLRMKDGELLAVRVEDAAVGEALLRMAGVSAERQALQIRLPSRAEQQPAGRASALMQLLVLALFGLPCVAASAWVVRELLFGRAPIAPMMVVIGIAVATSVLLLARIVRFLASPRVVVGADGVALGTGRSMRFYPYRQVAAVQKYPLGVRLRMRDGKSVLLPTWTSASVALAQPGAAERARPSARLDEARREVLYERIRSAMAIGGGDLSLAELSLLDRGGRTMDRWREDLGHLLETTGYRDVRLDRSRLEQVLSDPAATPTRRVAAAFALSKAKDPAVTNRARIATEACADDRLRIAITRAVEGEIDESIAELEVEPQAPRRRTI